MDENVQTINTDAGSSAAQPADPQTMPQGDAHPSTETINTDTGIDAGDGAGNAAEEAEALRFDRHPRFRELNARAKESEARASKMEAELALLRAKLVAFEEAKETAQPADKALPYQDITRMTPEDLLSWQTERPVEYAANLYAQIRSELTAELKREEAAAKQERATRDTLDEYRSENKDFDEMWQSGEIKQFLAKHPGHTPISAHMVLTRDKRMREAVENAKKETREAISKEHKAKQSAAGLTSGPTNRSVTPDNALRNTKQNGGLVAVLAARLRAMRQQTG